MAVILTWCLTAPSVAPAQQSRPHKQEKTPPITQRAVASEPILRNEIKARYVVRQLDLTDEQRKMSEALLDSIMAGPPPEPPLDRIRELMEQMREAQAAGDASAEARVRQELKNLGQTLNKENIFYQELERELPPDKVEQLHAALQRLEHNPSGAVRPIDLLHIVGDLKLSDEQEQKVAELKRKFQERANEIVATFNDARRFQLVRQMMEKLDALLTPEQRSEFHSRVDRLRVDLLPEVKAFDARAAAAKKKESSK
ncbi:MAG: hypothetical protein D6744_17020 [Planctomycetota bacterium]|nr:MAG: hypothetical protein D6744_17020 [Planctomycetota bacterium]